MKIEDIKGRRVKLGPRSITCLDDDDKAVGVVTGVTKYLNLPLNKQVDHSAKLRASGIWTAGELGMVYVADGKAYYISDLRPIEFYEKYLADKQFEDDDRKYQQRKAAAQQAPMHGITVIPCYVEGARR